MGTNEHSVWRCRATKVEREKRRLAERRAARLQVEAEARRRMQKTFWLELIVTGGAQAVLGAVRPSAAPAVCSAALLCRHTAHVALLWSSVLCPCRTRSLATLFCSVVVPLAEYTRTRPSRLLGARPAACGYIWRHERGGAGSAAAEKAAGGAGARAGVHHPHPGVRPHVPRPPALPTRSPCHPVRLPRVGWLLYCSRRRYGVRGVAAAAAAGAVLVGVVGPSTTAEGSAVRVSAVRE